MAAPSVGLCKSETRKGWNFRTNGVATDASPTVNPQFSFPNELKKADLDVETGPSFRNS